MTEPMSPEADRPLAGENLRTKLPDPTADHYEVFADTPIGLMRIGAVSRTEDRVRLTYCPDCDREQPKLPDLTGRCAFCDADYGEALQKFVTVGCDEQA